MIEFFWFLFVAQNFLQTTVIFAFFQIETPKDVQEKFGRTVVEKYLLW